MIGSLHGVFLVYLGLCLAWNLNAARRAAPDQGRTWEQRLFLPLFATLLAVLLRDRLTAPGTAWLTTDWVRHLFPAAFGLALVQNALTIKRRGARLGDIPLVLYNVGLGACLLVADMSLGGATLSQPSAALLHDHTLLQLLLGTHRAQAWTLSWHVPLLLPREAPRSLVGAVGGLGIAGLAGFCCVVLVALHSPAERVQVSFAGGPRPTGLRADLDVGVLTRPSGPQPLGVPGRLRCWVLPADHDGRQLPPLDDGRPLVLALRTPDAWHLNLPPPAQAAEQFVAGAERLAALLQPSVLLPFPEPDGEATLVFGPDMTPEDWAVLYERAARRVRLVSPTTRLAAQLAGHGERSRELLAALAPWLDIAGPHLQPGGMQRGGAALADEVLSTWVGWRDEMHDPPALWVLSAGLSPLAYGERSQLRFLEICLDLADTQPSVDAILIQAWRDRGHTQGLHRPNGSQRLAGRWLAQFLGSRPEAPGG